uniref:Transposase n=1 Tax=Globodera pallida TaxID=36090 RepID=A0A183C7D7_GLOPA
MPFGRVLLIVRNKSRTMHRAARKGLGSWRFVHESRKLHENIRIAYERLKFVVDRQLNGESSYEAQFEQLKRKYEEKTKKSMVKKRALMAEFRERGEDIQRRAPCQAKGALRSEKDGD